MHRVVTHDNGNRATVFNSAGVAIGEMFRQNGAWQVPTSDPLAPLYPFPNRGQAEQYILNRQHNPRLP